MKFGYFDDLHREYVIEKPDTPLPWINYLGNEDYFGIISNTAGGYSFYKDARLRRLTRYRYNNVPTDYGGRYLYFRDNALAEENSKPSFWSPGWQPVKQELDEYECRHGFGYTTIRSSLYGINSQVKYFVPLGENLEIWRLEIRNDRPETVNLSVFSAVEFCLWDAWDDATNFQRNLSIGEVEIEDGVIYHKSEYRERRNHFAYFACSEELAGFDTQREDFLGPYRGWDIPLAVEKGKVSNSKAVGWSPVGVHQIDLEFQPAEKKTIIFILGYFENPNDEKFLPAGSQTINKQEVKKVISNYVDVSKVDSAFDQLKMYWDDMLAKFKVETPNEHVNRMVNLWNVYQMMVTFNLSRSASGFESGIGRGMGFRDCNQDMLGFMHLDAERSRQRIFDVAATQMENGGAYHQYQTLTKRGNNRIGSDFNDDPLWLILAVASYLKETGDWAVLDENIVYDNQPGTEKPLFDHLQRSIQYTLDRSGPHGLPLIGRADWNDCLNLNCFSESPGESFQTTGMKEGKVAESLFIAGQFVMAAREMSQISMFKGKHQESVEYNMLAEKMEATILEHGWDGDWFLRAYDSFGKPVGSKTCEEGSIFIEPQGICIMAGLGLDDGKAVQALDAVERYLATPHGIVLQNPAYSHYYLEYGEISSYPPGYKENAGIFCHSNPWIMIAEAMAGRGDRALDYYLRINPSSREEISELHKCEPYVYAQMIAGKDAPTHGEAKNSWLTGTAAWNYVAITQWILGIRPVYNGLQIAPVIPEDWNGFRVSRLFRGAMYQIEVIRIGPGLRVELEVDGKILHDNIIPLAKSNKQEIHVVARIGKPE